ncbi:phospho-sugar mutase [Collinsella aerofaciens]|uniref:phospho-sugar mutase n=1 Tax=Collinsella aerofaciens TaxID=74426 RepID=UPI00319E52C2
MNLDDIFKNYARWINCCSNRDRYRLISLDINQINEAFYRELSFGTGGLRGKIGLGSNRLNVYTVGKATQGLADYLNSTFENPTVALCRDTRHGSEEFVRRVAEVLAENGIKSYLFERVEPTPALSFAVRELNCSAGVNITASHNPAAYNGYKVYGADGCQITVEAAEAIQAAIDPVDCFDGVKAMAFDRALEEGLVQWVPERVLDRYIEETLEVSTGEDCSALRIVYTPLHGVGLECVSRVLEGIGVADVATVDEQCVHDGDFPTCPYPNPEVREALELGLNYCDRVKPDLLLATDPDTDRVGIAVPHAGEYKLLTGNEVGLLLLNFLASKASGSGADMAREVACTTIVSAPMADDVARARGLELRRTLTGFKFIGEQVGVLESGGREGDFLMGFEESYGYLAGTSVRDKDAVVASMLICELAAYWKKRGMDLYEAMERLYKEYGHWSSALLGQAYEGPEGASDMAAMMSGLREHAPEYIGGTAVAERIDYAQGAPMPVVNPSDEPQRLPEADVLEFRLADGSRVLFRPSGTEPKAKAYVFAKGADRSESEAKLAALVADAKSILGGTR